MQSLLNNIYDSEFLAELTDTPIYIYESEKYKHIKGIPNDILLNAFYEFPEAEKEVEKLEEEESKALEQIFEDIKRGKTLFTFTKPRKAHDKRYLVRLVHVYTPSFYESNAVQITCFEVHENTMTDIDYIPNGHTTHRDIKDFSKNVVICSEGLTFYEPWNN